MSYANTKNLGRMMEQKIRGHVLCNPARRTNVLCNSARSTYQYFCNRPLLNIEAARCLLFQTQQNKGPSSNIKVQFGNHQNHTWSYQPDHRKYWYYEPSCTKQGSLTDQYQIQYMYIDSGKRKNSKSNICAQTSK